MTWQCVLKSCPLPFAKWTVAKPSPRRLSASTSSDAGNIPSEAHAHKRTAYSSGVSLSVWQSCLGLDRWVGGRRGWRRKKKTDDSSLPGSEFARLNLFVKRLFLINKKMLVQLTAELMNMKYCHLNIFFHNIADFLITVSWTLNLTLSYKFHRALAVFWRTGICCRWEFRLRWGEGLEDRHRPVQDGHCHRPLPEEWACFCRR